MNRYEPKITPGREAQVRFLDGDYQIIVPGDYVRCAVTGQPIPLEHLRYWSVERQEAYASAAISMERYLATRPQPER